INMLLADYHLWMAKVRNGGNGSLQAAKQAADAVIGDASLLLLNDFGQVFSNELNQEIIFAWNYTQDEFTGGYPSDYLVPLQYISPSYVENPIKVGSHQQWIFLTDEFKAFLEEDDRDTRTRVTFDTYFDAPKNATFQWINKLAGSWENATRVFDSDVVVYRYADALLLSAEIENALGNRSQAIQRLNEVAARAYKVDAYYAAGMSQQQ